jgi:hypothetical protein
MTAVVILNIVFAVFVVGGIVALLGRAIVADSPGSGGPLSQHRRTARERPSRSRRADRVTSRVEMDPVA